MPGHGIIYKYGCYRTNYVASTVLTQDYVDFVKLVLLERSIWFFVVISFPLKEECL